MEVCDWFNSTLHIQQFIALPQQFTDDIVSNKYLSILSSPKKSDNQFKFNIFTEKFINSDKIILSHKYQIFFSDKQYNTLKSYFEECKKVYDLCVDIWHDYKECTSNWQIFKDVLFNFLYRDSNTKNLPIKDIKTKIVTELKKKQNEFNLENEKNQETIKILKLQAKEQFKKEMEEYNKKVKENKKAVIKEVITKPKMAKVKIDKIKKPPKPMGDKILKPAPDEMLKAEIRDFCRNLSNAREQAFNNGKFNLETKKFNDDAFVMNHKNISNTQTVSINERAITEDGIYIRALGKIDCDNWNYIKNNYPLNKECKLQYDFTLNKYYLMVVFEGKEIISDNRKEVVALDPGEKIFNYFYSNELQGKLGNEMRVKIIGWQRKIKKLQSILDKKKNSQGKTIRNKKSLKNKIRKLFLKIKGYVNEIHKKSAKFLCENFENILIPEFKTKPMISKNKIKTETERIKNIRDKKEAQKELRILNKKIKLSGEVKFVLSMQSHYKFKEYLKALAKRYRTKVHEVDESYTSQCCTVCGVLSKEYDNRVKKCINCGLKIDRDTNGSRNIYLKSICSMPGVKTRLASL